MAVFNVSTYEPESEAKYFVDCNVLMYEFYPYGGYRHGEAALYSRFFSKAISNHSTLYFTDMLLSEFINTYVQAEYRRIARQNNWRQDKWKFKHEFKFTEEYGNILKEVGIILKRQIFPIFRKKDVPFSKIDLNGIFDRPEYFDFNDRYYAKSFPGEDIYIVTNDADFMNVEGLNIVTGNPRMLE